MPKKTVWKIIHKYKRYGNISRLPGSGRPFKLSREALTLIKERKNHDDETSGTQILKMLEVI